MEFRIADTFTDSLSRLTGDEQKAVKTTAFDLQMNPASPGLSFHKLDKAKDKNFWSVRVSEDIRLIVHRTGESILLCYVDHHHKAYSWAERRKLQTHPKTGAAQFVEIRETVQEIFIPTYVEVEAPPPKKAKGTLFKDLNDDDLLGYGVPSEWLSDVRAATEDSILSLVEHLPHEAAEALLELATGGKPIVVQPTAGTGNPFDHPNAQRRFRVMKNVEELQRALEFPWDKWTIFLHPEQREWEWVERDQSGPARVSGSAGTGKTIVALHRAVHLARRNPESRGLLTTFSEPLANALKIKLARLVSSEPRLAERIDVYSLDVLGEHLFKSHCGKFSIADQATVRGFMKAASKNVGGHKFSHHFLVTEWEQIVDAWQLSTWEEYRDVARLGRKTRLPENQRKILWAVFEEVHSKLKAWGLVTRAGLFTNLAAALKKAKNPPFEFVVCDEAQDIGIPHLKMFAALGVGRPNSLFFAGDQGQRIFQQPFSWKALGVDIRGRARNLWVNYRTSHQIRKQADRLLGQQMIDIDGNAEQRSDTVSVFNGPPPEIRVLKTEGKESEAVGKWLACLVKTGHQPHECGLFVRSERQIERAKAAAKQAGLPFKVLDDRVEGAPGHLSIGTMHVAKGLEFRAVVVMACDDEIIPLQERIESVGDESDLQEVYDTERHLLYVACTRARDNLLVTSVDPASEFLDDLRV